MTWNTRKMIKEIKMMMVQYWKKNRRENEVNKDNEAILDHDPKTFVDVVVQLNLGKIVNLQLLGKLLLIVYV